MIRGNADWREARMQYRADVAGFITLIAAVVGFVMLYLHAA